MINLLIIFTFVFTIAYSIIFTARKAFFSIYLFALLFIPYMSWHISGIPDISLEQAAALAIAIIFIFSNVDQIKFTYTDFLILAYCIVIVYSEYISGPLSVTKGQVVRVTVNIFLPYLFAKVFVGLRGDEARFSRKIVILLFFVALTMPYELKMTQSLFYKVWGYLYNFNSGALILRFGFTRFKGPYEHAILAGVVLGTAVYLNIWLIKNKKWDSIFRWFPYFCLGWLFLTFLTTFSRGPIYSFIVALPMAWLGYTKKRWRDFILGVGGSIIASLFAYIMLLPYLSEQKTIFENEWNTIGYRQDLFTNYLEVINEKPFFGWGIEQWPTMDGQISIDNNYLFTAITHGLIALFFFMAATLFCMLRLFIKGMTLDIHDTYNRSLLFTLFSILLFMSLTFFTVYMGTVTEPLYFMMLGWSDGYLKSLKHKRYAQPG